MRSRGKRRGGVIAWMLDDVRAPGVADLPGGAGRRHAPDRGATARYRSTGGLPAALAGLTAGGRGLTAGGRGLTAGGRGPAARPDPTQRGPDGERRDPGRRGDLPGGVQPGDPRRQRGRQLRRAPSARGGRGPARPPRRRPAPGPTARWWPGPPRTPPPPGPAARPAAAPAAPRPADGPPRPPASQGEGGQPVHRDQPAVLAGQHAHPGAIPAAPAGSSGRGTWSSTRAIIHHPARPVILQEFPHKPGAKGGNDTP